MAFVTYTDFTSNQQVGAPDVYGYFYSWGGNSLETINGRLGVGNVDITATSGLIDYTLVQDGAVSGGSGVSGNASLDFFADTRPMVSGSIDPTVTTTNGLFSSPPGGDLLEDVAESYHVAVPGSAIQFFLPQKSRVLLTWQIVWTNDAFAVSDTSNVRLFIDDNYSENDLIGTTPGIFGPLTQGTAMRRVRRTMFSTNPGSYLRYLRDRYKGRYWCGHFWVDSLERGWHSASLRVVASGAVKQTRVRCRNMKHIYFSYRDS